MSVARRGEVTMVRVKGTSRRLASYGLAIHVAAYACSAEPEQREGPAQVEATPRSTGGTRNLPRPSRDGASGSDDGGFSGSLLDDEDHEAEGGAAGERGRPRNEGGAAGAEPHAEGGEGSTLSAGMGGRGAGAGGAAGHSGESADPGGAAGASPGIESPEPSAGAGGSDGGGRSESGGTGGRGGRPGDEESPHSGRDGAGATGGWGTSGNAGVSGNPGAAGHAGASGGVGSTGPLPPGDVATGFAIVVDYGCTGCHGTDLAGRGYFRNITPDVLTGVGAWSDDELALGIRKGKNKLGTTMCVHMPHYPWSDQKVADVIAYLRSIPAKVNLITSVCPGHGT